MRITKIKYAHKVPGAQYESEMVEATAVVFEHEDANDAMESLKKYVNSSLEKSEQLELPILAAKKETEGVVDKPTGIIEPLPKREIKEAPKEPDTITKEKIKDAVEKTAKKKAKKKRVKKPKHVIYDRDNDNHKKELGVYLNENFPKWEEDKPKAAALSKGMDKKVPLYDENGEIMQEFKDEVAKGMK